MQATTSKGMSFHQLLPVPRQAEQPAGIFAVRYIPISTDHHSGIASFHYHHTFSEPRVSAASRGEMKENQTDLREFSRKVASTLSMEHLPESISLF